MLAAVRQTAGRSLAVDKSSNGKGSRTILPLVMERDTVGKIVHVFGGVVQKIKQDACPTTGKQASRR